MATREDEAVVLDAEVDDDLGGAMALGPDELANFWDEDGIGDEDGDHNKPIGSDNNKGGGGKGNDYSDIFGNTGDDDDDDGEERELTEEEKAEAAYRARQAEIAAELDSRTGRLWTDEWVIPDEEWMTSEKFDDTEDWTPALATRRSVESVKIWEGGVPTLGELSGLELPPPLPPHPGHGDPVRHARYRKRRMKERLRASIQVAAHDDLRRIVEMESWEEKQEAVDDLFEAIEERVREREPVLGKLPNFSEIVEKGLEDVLLMVQAKMRGAAKAAGTESEGSATADDGSSAESESEEAKGGADAADGSKKAVALNVDEIVNVAGVGAEAPVPVFMDLLAAARSLEQQPKVDGGDDDDENADDGEAASAEDAKPPSVSKFFRDSNDAGVPNLIYPLTVHHKGEGVGRMVEEWELAANKETKRIMMRDATREIASAIADAANCCGGEPKEEDKGAARVFVAGKRGVGKTAALAGIVASARVSGHIVLYLPDGDRLRKFGFYNEPCQHRKGLYNLPEIAKEICGQLMTAHGDDVRGMRPVQRDAMGPFLTDDQIRRVFRTAYKEDETVSDEEAMAMTELSLDKILSVGIASAQLSSGCYSTVIHALMNQTEKPFTVVIDEFNVYYDHGHYFNMEYDPDVRRAIPLNRITIFKPYMDAMGLYPTEAGTEMNDELAVPSREAMMKWGSIVAGTSECRAVKRSFTQSLTDAALALTEDEDHPMRVVDVRRFSEVEVQHVLYNFELTGVGRLRFDRGNTALNPEEVDYLRLVSGGSGQQLMDACMLP